MSLLHSDPPLASDLTQSKTLSLYHGLEHLPWSARPFPPDLCGLMSLWLLAFLLFLKIPSTLLHLDLSTCYLLYLKHLSPQSSHISPSTSPSGLGSNLAFSISLNVDHHIYIVSSLTPSLGTTDIPPGFIFLCSTHNYAAFMYLFILHCCYLMLLKVVCICPRYRMYLLTSICSPAELKQSPYSG